MSAPKNENVEVVEATDGHEAPVEVKNYTDDKGNTWQLNAEDAKRLGFEQVQDKAVKAATVSNKAVRPAKDA